MSKNVVSGTLFLMLAGHFLVINCCKICVGKNGNIKKPYFHAQNNKTTKAAQLVMLNNMGGAHAD